MKLPDDARRVYGIFLNEEDIPPLLSTKLGVVFNESAFDETIEKIYNLILKKLEL